MQKLSLVIVCALSSACGLFDGGGDDTSPIIDGDWPVDRPMKETVAPGELVQLHVTGVDAALTDVYVWFDEERTLALHPLHIDDGTAKGDGDVVVSVAAPFLRGGDHTLYLGDSTAPRTGAIAVRVVVPPPRLSKDEFAQVMSSGLDQMLGDVETLLGNPSPEWQAMMSSIYSADERARIDAVLSEAHTIAPVLAADIRALSDEDAAALQAMLDERGVLPGFEMALAGTTTVARAVAPLDGIDLRDRLPHLLSRLLYTIDLASLSVSVLGDTLNIVSAIALVVPGLQAVAAVSFEAEIIPALIRHIIDNFVPTDLYELTRMEQPYLYRGMSSRWLYWGTFSTEQQTALELGSSLDNVLASIFAEALGAKFGPGKVEAFKGLIATFFTKLGLSLPQRFEVLPDNHVDRPRIKAIVNMQLYDLTVGDLLILFPMFYPAKFIFELVDIELKSPIAVVQDESDALGRDATVKLTYRDDAIFVDGIDWPGTVPTQEAKVALMATGYRFTTTPLFFLVDIPTLESVFGYAETSVRYGRNPADPNGQIEEARLMLTEIPGTSWKSWLNFESPTTMVVPITIEDLAGGRFDNVTVDIAVNGVVQLDDLVLISGGQVARNVTLGRGVNTITVTAVAGHVTPYDNGGFSASAPVQIHVPLAVQPDKSRSSFLNAGESHSFEIVSADPVELG